MVIECERCHRHVRATEAACPFCGGAGPRMSGRVMNAVGGLLTTLVLAACYGGYDPKSTTFTDDVTPDGFTPDTGTTPSATGATGETGTTTGGTGATTGGTGATTGATTGGTGATTGGTGATTGGTGSANE